MLIEMTILFAQIKRECAILPIPLFVTIVPMRPLKTYQVLSEG